MVVIISFKLTDRFVELSETADGLAAKHGLESTGSGAGFGRRDIDYESPDEERAQTFLAEVRAHPDFAGMEVELRLLDEED
ncbi:MAG TPA: hypothetical protein VF909_01280 [Roseiflexaceae bacterium]